MCARPVLERFHASRVRSALVSRGCAPALSLLAVLSLMATAGCNGDAPTTASRNLLFVVFDTTRADHLGCYGYDGRPTSPTVDRLAREGVVLENAYSASTLTPVSAGSFLSGTLPYRHGVRSLFVVGEESLAGDVPALFELLGEGERATSAFVSAKPMGGHYGLGRGFDLYQDDLSQTLQDYGIEQFGDAPQRPGDATTDLAVEWLRENGTRPFATMVHLFDAHDMSFVPPREFLDQHLGLPIPAELGRAWDRNPLANLEELKALYDVEILFMDAQLQRLLDLLDELGVRDETLIVFLADHGESFGEHGYFSHGWLSEEQLRVPVVMAGPGLVSSTRLTERVRTVDLVPTLCELFGLDIPAGLDGSSVLGLLRGEEEDFPREVYAEVHHAPGDPRGREANMYTVIEGDWKYIHRPATKSHELYNLRLDPGESDNRFGSKPRVGARLARSLLERGALGSGGVSLEGLTAEQIRDLQALGYLGEVGQE